MSENMFIKAKKIPIVNNQEQPDEKTKVKITVKSINSSTKITDVETKPKNKTAQVVSAILDKIKDSSKKYTLCQFDQLVVDIHNDINGAKDQNGIKKLICKYGNVSHGKIYFNIEHENEDFTYKLLKNSLEKSKSDDHSHSHKPPEEKCLFGKKKVISIYDDDDDDNEPNEPVWQHPPNQLINYVKHAGQLYEPYGSQWIHDEQSNDILNSITKTRSKTFDKLAALEYPEQRSPEWFALRDGRMTASDGGCVIGEDHNQAQFKFLIKKVLRPAFESNMFCYHGTKHEQIATMIYEYRSNTKVQDFGLVAHPTIDFLAASPDGIVCKYKMDGKSLTKNVGRMLEIKCPPKRVILLDGKIKGEICPDHYWVQVQLQLECCDLDECDFWQCDISEYTDREDFIRDTDLIEPFRSKTTGFEKGCLIQLLPKNKTEEIKNGKYMEVVWGESKHIYPPKIEMTPYECDMWIAETMAKFNSVCNSNYFFDKIIYWKLNKSKCVTIERDRDWFTEKLPEFRKMWNYVLYLRTHEDKSKIFFDYINYLPIKNNKKILQVIDFIYNEPHNEDTKKVKEYTLKIHEIIQQTFKNKQIKDALEAIDADSDEDVTC